MNTDTDDSNSDKNDPAPLNKDVPDVSVRSTDQRILNGSKLLQPGGREFGGPAGLEPTRYGDWENKGRCIDF
jgi:hypothetical protein